MRHPESGVALAGRPPFGIQGGGSFARVGPFVIPEVWGVYEPAAEAT